jgi:hypothetical protein
MEDMLTGESPDIKNIKRPCAGGAFLSISYDRQEPQLLQPAGFLLNQL